MEENCVELRWRVVHSPRVAIRSGPSTSSAIVGVVKTGAEVQSRGAAQKNWIELTAASAPTGPGGARQGWMMVDGAEVGLGRLLRQVIQLPPPRIVFIGTRALVVSWEAAPERVPVELQIHLGERGSGLALRQPARAAASDAATNHRVGGLQPDMLLSLRLVAVLAEDSTANECSVSSEWVGVRTRASRAHDRPLCRRVSRDDGTSCSASPDVFGRLRGQVLSSTGARLDCPTGLWMPSELFHGGLNAVVANFRCGDCCLSPAQHEDFGPAQQPPQEFPVRHQQDPEPEPPMLTRDECLLRNTWNNAQQGSYVDKLHIYNAKWQP